MSPSPEVQIVRVGGGFPRTAEIAANLANNGLAGSMPVLDNRQVDWEEDHQDPAQRKQGDWVTNPIVYGHPELGDAAFRIGVAGPILNGFWPLNAAKNCVILQRFANEGFFLPRGYVHAKGEFEGTITTHATTSPLFHLQFHPNSNIFALFRSDPANLYNQLGAQANLKFLVPKGISAKGFICRWWLFSRLDEATGLWAQAYHAELVVNAQLNVVTAVDFVGSTVTTTPITYSGYINVIKAPGANGTFDPVANNTNVALRFALYLNAGDPGDGQNLLDVSSARFWRATLR